jgi:hypothetical protein
LSLYVSRRLKTLQIAQFTGTGNSSGEWTLYKDDEPRSGRAWEFFSLVRTPEKGVIHPKATFGLKWSGRVLSHSREELILRVYHPEVRQWVIDTLSNLESPL